ncbi:MAG: hypothetical protein CMI18_07865 [Opitutaceae bacterium]|nr:hypothetical protein [Opitutaceae bacterium]|tara:strand:+ start:6788 stop:7237 length:450 start_codon:yes stop_codon:yes gene_type:complete
MKAFLSIILLLAFGLGVWGNTPTSEKIAEWKEDAKNGDAWAQFTLGIAYAIGRGVPQDDKAAINWYKKAAEQGHADSQAGLGLINWEYGNGIVEDKVQAYAWLNIAASNDDKWKETKSELAQKMTIEQIAEAQKLSREMIKANPKLLGD